MLKFRFILQMVCHQWPLLALPTKLSPADVLMEGAHFDLPIAVALLVAMGVMPFDNRWKQDRWWWPEPIIM